MRWYDLAAILITLVPFVWTGIDMTAYSIKEYAKSPETHNIADVIGANFTVWLCLAIVEFIVIYAIIN